MSKMLDDLKKQYSIDTVPNNLGIQNYNSLYSLEDFYTILVKDNQNQYNITDLIECHLIFKRRCLNYNIFEYDQKDIILFLNNIELDLKFLDTFLYKNGKHVSFSFKYKLRSWIQFLQFSLILIHYNNQSIWTLSNYINLNSQIKKFIDYNYAHAGIVFEDYIDCFYNEYSYKKNLKIIYNEDFTYKEIHSSNFEKFYKKNKSTIEATLNNASSILQNIKTHMQGTKNE